MANYLPLPDGSFVTAKEGETPEATLRRAQQDYPEAFGITPTDTRQREVPKQVATPEGGFVAAVKAGARNLAGDTALTLGKAGIIDPATAEKYRAEQEEAARGVFKPTEDDWATSPWQKLKETAGQSLPYMAAPLAAGAGAAALGAPALAAAGAAGLASTGVFTGSNLARQVDTGKTLEQTSGSDAFMAAIPQAALDMVSFRMIPGIGKIFGAAGEKITEASAKQIAEQTLKQAAKDYAAKTGKAMTAEGLTETAQQVLERLQAGLALDDPEARKEYFESFVGGAALAGPLGAGGRFVERGQIKAGGEQMKRDRLAGEAEAAAADATAKQYPGPMPLQGPQPLQGPPAPPPQPRHPTEVAADVARLNGIYEQHQQALSDANEAGDFDRSQQISDAMNALDAQRAALAGELKNSANSPGARRQEAVRVLEKVEADLRRQTGPGTDPAKVRALLERRAALIKFLQENGDPRVEGQEQFGQREQDLRAGATQQGVPNTAPREELSPEELLAAQSTGPADNVMAGYQANEEFLNEAPDLIAARKQRTAEIERKKQQEELSKQAAQGSAANAAPPYMAQLGEMVRNRAERAATAESIANGTAPMPDTLQQPRLFGEEQNGALPKTGSWKMLSLPQLLAKFRMARAAGDVQTAKAMGERIRDMRAQEQNEAQKTLDPAVRGDMPTGENAELLSGAKAPEGVARVAQAADNRANAFAKLFTLLNQSNKGRVDAEGTRAAEQAVHDNLIREIEARLGRPLSKIERTMVFRDSNELIVDLKRRVGDTRSDVKKGFGEDAEYFEAQNAAGQWDKDIPPPGTFGYPNVETRKKGRQTFSDRYAAAESISEGLDAIRDRYISNPAGVDTNAAPSLREALGRAEQTPNNRLDPALLQQVQDNLPALERHAPQEVADWLNSATRGNASPALAQDVKAALARLEAGKRSESETRNGVTRTVQQREVPGIGDETDTTVAFNTFSEFEEYLAGPEVKAARARIGELQSTVAEVAKRVAPMAKKAAELEAQIVKVQNEEIAPLVAATKEAMHADVLLEQAADDLETDLAPFKRNLLAAENELAAVVSDRAEVMQKAAQAADRLETELAQFEKGQAPHSKAMVELATAAHVLKTQVDALSKAHAEAKTAMDSVLTNGRALPRDYMRVAIDKKEKADRARMHAISAHGEVMRAYAAVPAAPKISDGSFLRYLKEDAVLQGEIEALSRKIAQLTSVRDITAGTLARARKELGADFDAAKAINAEALAAAQARAEAALAKVAPLSTQANTLRRALAKIEGAMAKAGERAAENRNPVKTAAQTLSEREAADGKARAEGQVQLETREEAPGTARTQVSFEKKRAMDLEAQEAPLKLADAESRAQDTNATPEERDAAKAEAEAIRAKADTKVANREKTLATYYRMRSALLDKIAATKAEGAQELLNKKELARVAKNPDLRETLEAPKREKLGDAVRKLNAKLEEVDAKISKRQGIERTTPMTKVERAEAADRTLRETRGLLPTFNSQEELDAFERESRRATSPATRIVQTGGIFRSGDPLTAEVRKKNRPSSKQPVVESRDVIERDVPITKKEMQAANNVASAETVAEAAALAKKEAAAEQKLAERQKKTRAEEAIDETDNFDEFDDIDDAAFARSGGYDDEMQFAGVEELRKVPESVAKALSEGDLTGALDALSADGGTELTRALAEKLRPLLTTTKVGAANLKGKSKNAAKEAAGEYSPSQNTIFLQEGRPVTEHVLLHEAAHAATVRVLRMPEHLLTKEQRNAKHELKAMLKQLTNDKAFADEYGVKNLEEFVAELSANKSFNDKLSLRTFNKGNWLTKAWDAVKRLLGLKTPPGSNMQSAANAAFDKILMPSGKTFGPRLNAEVYANDRLAKAVEDTKGLIATKRTFRQAVMDNLNGTSFDEEAFNRPDPAALPEDIEKLRKQHEKLDTSKLDVRGVAFRTQAIDALDPIQRIAAAMKDSLKASQMMFDLRSYGQRMNFTAQAVLRGGLTRKTITRTDGRHEYVYEAGGNGGGLKPVVDILKDAPAGTGDATNQLFSRYLVAKRAANVGLDKMDLGGSVTQAHLDEVMAAIKATPGLEKVFERAAAAYHVHNVSLLRFAEQTGAISKEEVDRLISQGDYVPYYRQRDGIVTLVLGTETPIRIGSLKEQPHLKKLVGGDQPILDFMTSAVQNTHLLTDMALRNQATKDVAINLAQMGLADINNKANQAGPNVVHFYHEGKERTARIDTEAVGIPADVLVRGMEGIATTLPGILKVFGMGSQLLRRSITSSPLYMVRQLFRDSIAATFVSGTSLKTPLAALKQIGRNSDTKDTLDLRGVTGGQIFTGTTEDISNILGRLTSGKGHFMQLFHKLEQGAMEADAATRRAQFQSYRAQGLSEMESTMMALESMNFSRRGSSASVHAISQLIPFFNAQIQGLDVLWRAAHGTMPFNERLEIQKKLLTRGAMLAGMSMVYAMAMQDDEAYQNANPEEKYSNWFVRLPGVDQTVRLPVPFEIGYIFKSLPEAMVNMVMNDGTEDAKQAFGQILKQTIPGGTSMGVPQLVRPGLENALNKSFFTGRDLISPAEARLQPAQQYRDNTSETAKAIGDMFGLSPIKIENLVRGYTGGMGMALIQALGMPFEGGEQGGKAAKRLSDTPLFGTAFQPDDAGGIINRTYERVKEIQQAQATFNDMLKRGNRAQAAAFLQANAEDISKASFANSFPQMMADLAKAEAAVKASALSPAEKRERLDALRQRKIMLAKAVRGGLAGS